MRIVIAGSKGVGKSTVGRLFSDKIGLPYVETDILIEQQYLQNTAVQKTCREIYREHGAEYFRNLENQAVQALAEEDWKVIITGGSTLLSAANRQTLRRNSILVLLTAEPQAAWERAVKNGVPPWLEGPEGKGKFQEESARRNEVLSPYADIVLDTTHGNPKELAEELCQSVAQEMAVRCTNANTYGELIRVTTFGESHGPAIGAVLDGVRPGLPFDREEIQKELNRRRPGQSDVTTPRNEADCVSVLSGVFEGKTTGAPIALVIFNKNQDSQAYEGIKDLFRPGHADFTFYKKYGIRDYRGGGRSSGRETAGRVMAGAFAKSILQRQGVRILAHTVEIAGIRARTFEPETIEKNPVRCADPRAAEQMAEAIRKARDDSDSVGGIIQLEICGVPPGLGDPVFAKLDARLAGALMSLGAVKAVEIGDGFALTRMRGSQANDAMGSGGFLSNHAGGITGGISTGQPIVVRVGVKPTSSIARPQQTLDIQMQDRVIETHGRHDPCIVPRLVPVVESMAALVLWDAWEIQMRLNPDWAKQYGLK